jgi:hypothetical protein
MIIRLQFSMRVGKNFVMGQASLFTRSEIASMRDRTVSRGYSPAREEFRREHERHRAWGLRRRHEEKLHRNRDGGASNCAGEGQAHTATPAMPPSGAASQPAKTAAHASHTRSTRSAEPHSPALAPQSARTSPAPHPPAPAPQPAQTPPAPHPPAPAPQPAGRPSAGRLRTYAFQRPAPWLRTPAPNQHTHPPRGPGLPHPPMAGRGASANSRIPATCITASNSRSASSTHRPRCGSGVPGLSQQARTESNSRVTYRVTASRVDLAGPQPRLPAGVSLRPPKPRPRLPAGVSLRPPRPRPRLPAGVSLRAHRAPLLSLRFSRHPRARVCKENGVTRSC